MRTLALIYRTTSVHALEFWQRAQEEHQSRYARITAYTDQLTAAFGAPEGTDRREVWTRGDNVYGIDCARGERPPADSGWRLDAKYGIWMPRLRTRAGQDRRDELAALTTWSLRKHLYEIGVPQTAWGDSHIYQPGLHLIDGALYQTWCGEGARADVEAEAVKQHAVTWEPVKLSEWYALQEALAEAGEAQSA